MSRKTHVPNNGFRRRCETPITRTPLAWEQNPFDERKATNGENQMNKPKLKQARGALGRAINAGLTPPPPGYAGPQQTHLREKSPVDNASPFMDGGRRSCIPGPKPLPKK
jgi:hypothetical protein